MADYATLLRDRVTLTCRSVDRIFLQGYVPKLQTAGWVCRFLRDRRGFRVPSSAACGVLGDAFVRSVRRFAEASDIPVIHFKKGEDKEAVARPLIDAAAAEGGVGRVVLIGIAQERSMVWRSWRTRGCDGAGRPWMAWGRQSAMVNHFYFYLWDPDWGGAFWKTNSYAPYPVWIWLNGHEWAKRQCVRAGIGFTALDNGFASCDDPVRLQRICDRLGPGAVKSFFWRWCRRLPSPFTDADRRAGYVYELAFRQFEVADTRVFDRPAAGRAFFEGIIRDHLDIGRPSMVALTFDRRITSRTPGPFRTKVITEGVEPQVSCYYKSNRTKQYFKEHRALRTETVICDTRDFGIGRRVNTQNWRALRAVGEHANQRLCDAQAADAQPAPDVVTLAAVTRPSTIDGQHVPALRFGDPRVMAIFAVLCGFAHLIRGFDNRTLTRLVDELLGGYTRRQATYDLRRLRRKGLIERIPHTHRYQLTPHGRQVAVLFTKTHERILAAGFARLDPRLPHDLAARSPLATAWRKLDHALNDFITAGLAAA
jgi:DNA-binding MarR family transcriptional regulator